MAEVISSSKDLLDIIVQVLIVVVPVVIAWFIRTYVRGSVVERELAAIVRLSNSAIDFVENLDNRGALDLPSGVSKGAHKLGLAGQWLESELKRAGIKISDEAAEQWIASEFQKRVGDVRMVDLIARLTRLAIDMIMGLERSELIELPPQVDRITFLTQLGTDWLIAELAKRGASISREEALTWVRAELLQRLQREPLDELPAAADRDPLTDLARSAVAFVEKLEASGQLAPPADTDPAKFKTEVAVSWSVTEAAKQGLTASKTEITEAVAAALRQQDTS